MEMFHIAISFVSHNTNDISRVCLLNVVSRFTVGPINRHSVSQDILFVSYLFRLINPFLNINWYTQILIFHLRYSYILCVHTVYSKYGKKEAKKKKKEKIIDPFPIQKPWAFEYNYEMTSPRCKWQVSDHILTAPFSFVSSPQDGPLFVSTSKHPFPRQAITLLPRRCRSNFGLSVGHDEEEMREKERERE